MDIREDVIEYKNGIPCEAKLCRIRATEPHYHSHDLELIYCLEGKVTLVAGHQNVEICAGQVFSVDFRDIHYLYSDEENVVLLFHLDLKNLHMSWEYLENVFFSCESIHCYPYQQNAMDSIREKLLTVSYALKAGVDSSGYCRTSNEMLDILFKYFNWYNYENHDEYMNVELYDRFYRTLAYCNENYMNKISVSLLAEKEHVNRNYFSQFISKTVFTKFGLMLQYIRCYEAEQLLLKTDMPVAEISYACGFSDPKYFYSAFKFWWKTTPTQHRKKYREYMKTSFSSPEIEEQEAADIVREHMTKWLLEKNLQMC